MKDYKNNWVFKIANKIHFLEILDFQKIKFKFKCKKENKVI
jgi:hypothetical protein